MFLFAPVWCTDERFLHHNPFAAIPSPKYSEGDRHLSSFRKLPALHHATVFIMPAVYVPVKRTWRNSEQLFLNILNAPQSKKTQWRKEGEIRGGWIKRWEEQAPIIYFYAAFNLHFLFAADKSGQGTQGRWHPESSPGQRAAVNLSEAEYWLE